MNRIERGYENYEEEKVEFNKMKGSKVDASFQYGEVSKCMGKLYEYNNS